MQSFCYFLWIILRHSEKALLKISLWLRIYGLSTLSRNEYSSNELQIMKTVRRDPLLVEFFFKLMKTFLSKFVLHKRELRHRLRECETLMTFSTFYTCEGLRIFQNRLNWVILVLRTGSIKLNWKYSVYSSISVFWSSGSHQTI